MKLTRQELLELMNHEALIRLALLAERGNLYCHLTPEQLDFLKDLPLNISITRTQFDNQTLYQLKPRQPP